MLSSSRILLRVPTLNLLAVAGLLIVTPLTASAVGGPTAVEVASQAPVVGEISPTAGPVSGGSFVVVRGSGFVDGDGGVSLVRSVHFGTVPAVSFEVESGQGYLLDVIAPPHVAGGAALTVTTAAGTSGPGSASRFTYNGTQGHWTTLSGAKPRLAHTATLLRSGRVLIAGGCVKIESGGACPTATASAELYDPSTRSWSKTGSMTRPRIGQEAVLLPGGKVLVVGGCAHLPCALAAPDSSSTERAAEVYDPSTGHWSATGSMAFAHQDSLFGPTVTVLPSGPVSVCGHNCDKVLVVGASGSSQASYSDAELYDPGRGTWGATTPTQYSRSGQVAVLLHNGKVLVAGGINDPTITTPGAPELYDPAKASWSPTGNQEPHPGSTATLLPDGRVLVTGGAADSAQPGVEIYDPSAHPDPANPAVGGGSWMATPPPTEERGRATATLLDDGKVLVVGGSAGVRLSTTGAISGPPIGTADLYDEATGRWNSAGTMVGVRADVSYSGGVAALPAFTATLLNDGTVLVVGAGYKPSTSLRALNAVSSGVARGLTPNGPSAELYAPAGGRGGSRVSPLVLGLALGAAAVVVLALIIAIRAKRRPGTGIPEPSSA